MSKSNEKKSRLQNEVVVSSILHLASRLSGEGHPL